MNKGLAFKIKTFSNTMNFTFTEIQDQKDLKAVVLVIPLVKEDLSEEGTYEQRPE